MSKGWVTPAERQAAADERVADAIQDENGYSNGYSKDVIATRCDRAEALRAETPNWTRG